MIYTMSKALRFLFFHRKPYDEMTSYDENFHFKCEWLFLSITLGNFALLLLSYGSDDLMLKASLFSTGIFMFLMMVVYLFESLILQKTVGFPVCCINVFILLLSIFSWTHGIYEVELNEKCKECNKMQHYMIMPRNNAKDFTLSQKYEQLIKQEK